MNNVMEYNNFYAEINISLEDKVIYGKLLYINDLVTFEADNMDEIESSFHEAVDDYISYCDKIGKEPEKPFKGSFNVRISPAKHRAAAIKAQKEGVSLNQLVENAITNYLESDKVSHEQICEKIDTVEDAVSALNQNVSTFKAGYIAYEFSKSKAGGAI